MPWDLLDKWRDEDEDVPFFPSNVSGDRPEIGSEQWIKAQIAAKLPPEERDRPR